MTARPHLGWVYFIRPVGMDGPVKIGASRIPEQRIETLSSWSPFKLEVVAKVRGDVTLERNIHECFADIHSHKEWFRADPRLTELIEKLAAGVRIHDALDLNNRKGPIRRWAVGTRKYTPEQSRYLGYRTRLEAARRRAERIEADGDVYFDLPDDVAEIMDRWSWSSGHPQKSPTTEEMAVLGRLIDDPRAHCTRRLRSELF